MEESQSPLVIIRFTDGRNAEYEFHNCEKLTPGIFEKALDRLMDELMRYRNSRRVSEKQAERQAELDAGVAADAEVNKTIETMKDAEAQQIDDKTVYANETRN